MNIRRPLLTALISLSALKCDPVLAYDASRCASLSDEDMGLDETSINNHDNSGRTALMTAAASGCTKLVKSLLTKGASNTIRDVFGNTAISEAKQYNHPEVVRLLKETAEPAGAERAAAQTPEVQAVSVSGDDAKVSSSRPSPQPKRNHPKKLQICKGYKIASPEDLIADPATFGQGSAKVCVRGYVSKWGINIGIDGTFLLNSSDITGSSSISVKAQFLAVSARRELLNMKSSGGGWVTVPGIWDGRALGAVSMQRDSE